MYKEEANHISKQLSRKYDEIVRKNEHKCITD